MAKTKIKSRSKEPDLHEMIRDYWESLEEENHDEASRDARSNKGS